MSEIKKIQFLNIAEIQSYARKERCDNATSAYHSAVIHNDRGSLLHFTIGGECCKEAYRNDEKFVLCIFMPTWGYFESVVRTHTIGKCPYCTYHYSSKLTFSDVDSESWMPCFGRYVRFRPKRVLKLYGSDRKLVGTDRGAVNMRTIS